MAVRTSWCNVNNHSEILSPLSLKCCFVMPRVSKTLPVTSNSCICLCVSYNRHCVYKPHMLHHFAALPAYIVLLEMLRQEKQPSGYLASRPRGVQMVHLPFLQFWTLNSHWWPHFTAMTWHIMTWLMNALSTLGSPRESFSHPILSSCWVAEPQLGRSETWDRFHVQRPHRQDRRITALLCTALGIHGLSTFGKTQELTDPQRSGRISELANYWGVSGVNSSDGINTGSRKWS